MKEESFTSGYRIVAPRWAKDAFSGEGAKKYGGRWNSPGRPMVYLGGSRALTALELLVHLTSPLARAKPFSIIEVKIPTDLIADYPLRILPEDWRDSPASQVTAQIGDDWLSANKQLALKIPSAIITEESNILLNPMHSDFDKIIIEETRAFRFDKRL